MKYQLTRLIINNLQGRIFRSKKNMAAKTNVPYRMLLRVTSSSCSDRDLECVMDRIIGYCAVHKIPLNDLLQGFVIK